MTIDYVSYMCALYEDIHGHKPSQEWIDALLEDDGLADDYDHDHDQD
jgi:hypothetical protein